MKLQCFKKLEKKFGANRLIYLNGETPPAAQEAMKMVDGELGSKNPFQVEEWAQLSEQAAEKLGVKDLASEVRNKASLAINFFVDHNRNVSAAKEMVAYVFREVKKFLEDMRGKIFADKTKTVLDAYRQYKGVKRDAKAAKIVGDVEPTMKVSTPEIRANKVEAMTRGYSVTEKAISESTKVAELIRDGIIDAETAFKMGLKVDGVIGSADALRILKDGILTTEEAVKMGLNVQVVKFVPSFLARVGLSLEEAAMLTHVVRIGSRFAVVTNLALSAHDVYEQSQKLTAQLNSEGEGNAFEKAASIVEHTAGIEANRSARRDAAERKILDETDLSQKMIGARIMATEFLADASTFGIGAVDVTERGTLETAEHFVKGIVSVPTEALASAILGGSPEDKRKGAEKKSIERSLKNADALILQLNSAPRSAELEQTVMALSAATELAKRAIDSGTSASKEEVLRVTSMLRAATQSSPEQLS